MGIAVGINKAKLNREGCCGGDCRRAEFVSRRSQIRLRSMLRKPQYGRYVLAIVAEGSPVKALYFPFAKIWHWIVLAMQFEDCFPVNKERKFQPFTPELVDNFSPSGGRFFGIQREERAPLFVNDGD